MFSNVPFSVDPRTGTKIIDVARLTPDSDNTPVFTDVEILAQPLKKIDEVEMDGVTVSYGGQWLGECDECTIPGCF